MHTDFKNPVIEVDGIAYECGRKYGQATSSLL